MALKQHSSKLSRQNLGEFHENLKAWYAKSGRHHLPWRNTDNAYHILVSEVMLQQTQVETVLRRFYQPFLNTFPDLPTLANAPRDAVMHAWQGLGYYRRAGFLHETAKASGAALPNNYEQLIALPGIGKNTAHAVLAFAHHKPYAVMEANVKRIISRVFAWQTPSAAELWHGAELLLNHAEPFDYNQAMMDLGAMICTVRQPKCAICPARHICAGKVAPELYPLKLARKEVPVRKKKIIIVEDREGYIYAKPRETALLGGLYQFIELDESMRACEFNGKIYHLEDARLIGNIQQKYSHFTLQAEVFLLHYPGDHHKQHWHARTDMEKLPWSNAELKILELL